MDENRKTVVLEIGGDKVLVPMIDRVTPVAKCWLVEPFTRSHPTRIYHVSKITPCYIWVTLCGESDKTTRMRLERSWLAANHDWLIAFNPADAEKDLIVLEKANETHCICHATGSWMSLDIAGFYENVVGGSDDEGHDRLWLLPDRCRMKSIWPIGETVEVRKDKNENVRRRITTFDLYLIANGYVSHCKTLARVLNGDFFVGDLDY